VSREDRDEWNLIGLTGQVTMTKGQKTGDRWIKMRDISDTVEEWLIR
jgi:dsDNA-binding SOS-regulon protein